MAEFEEMDQSEGGDPPARKISQSSSQNENGVSTATAPTNVTGMEEPGVTLSMIKKEVGSPLAPVPSGKSSEEDEQIEPGVGPEFSSANNDQNTDSSSSPFTVEKVKEEMKCDLNKLMKDTKMIEEDSLAAGDNQNKNDIVYFVNKDAKITPSPVLQYVLDMDQPYDTIVSCADGKIGAHRLVLASASQFVGKMFNSFNHRLGEIACLILPDVRLHIMKIILNFCYTGLMVISKEDENEVLDAIRALQIGTNANITLNEVIIRQQLVEPEPGPSSRLSEGNQQSNLDSMPTEEEAGLSTPFQTNSRRKQVAELDDLLSSSSDSEAESSSDSEKDDNTDPSYRAKSVDDDKTAADDRPRIKLPPIFSNDNVTANGKATGDGDKAPYEFLITSDSKSRRLFKCYHCVGAFKSLETITNHLDQNHNIYVDSKKANVEELKQILYCERCSKPHNQVSKTAACLSRRHKTRCYLCLESFKQTEFEKHIKEKHVVFQKKGMFAVKCRWCDAGIILQSPIDNKAISCHCYSQHFPSGDCNLDSLPVQENHDAKQGNSREKNTDKHNIVDEEKEDTLRRISSSSDTDSLFTPLETPSKPTAKPSVTSTNSKKTIGSGTTTDKKKDKGAPKTPKKKSNQTSSSNNQADKGVPTVIAMLQRASAKRKRELEEKERGEAKEKQEHGKENRTKRARLDSSSSSTKPTRPQTARRTGVPVGRLINPDNLQEGVPTFKSQERKRGKSSYKLLDLDLTALPNVLVRFNYRKNFIMDCLTSKRLEGNDTNNDNLQNENEVKGTTADKDNTSANENLENETHPNPNQ